MQFRLARRDDLDAIVRMLADDPLGNLRERHESPLPDAYLEAFEAIDSDPNNELVVVEVDGAVIGVLQLTYIPSLTYVGTWRASIEGVRVDKAHRSSGIGHDLFEWAIERAGERGCRVVQLTSDKRRPEALRFYESLGFLDSHEGLKLALE